MANFPGRTHRPLYGGTEKSQTDPHWRNSILFHEYFHGDNGAGLGAGHQTGLTGVVARLMHLVANFTPDRLREGDTAVRPGKSGGGGGQRPLNVESTKAMRR